MTPIDWILLAGCLMAAAALSAAWRVSRISGRNRRLAVELTARNESLQAALAAQQRVQQALDTEHALFHTLLDNLPDRIYFKDAQSRFILVNHAMLELFKVATVEQVTGKSDFDFFEREHAQPAFDDELAIMTSGEAVINKIEREPMPDGRLYWVSTTKVPLRDKEHKIIGTFGISRDITDLKNAEDGLKQSNIALNLRNEQLHQANEAQRKAHEELQAAQSRLMQSEKLAALGQLVAGVAHEINNPLSFVSNNVVVLQRDLAALRQIVELYRQADAAVESARPELAQQIRALAERLDLNYTLTNLDEVLVRSRDGLKRIQQIVRDLRDFARLDESDLHAVDLNKGIESTVNMVRGLARSKQVTIDLELQALALVTCFPAKINQVIMNLVTNAIAACGPGQKVTIRTSGAAGTAANEAVRIDVIDTGAGIDPAIRGRIFDPFFTTKPQGQGTGLGLSISYGIVRDHHGAIDVESTPGQGSRFSVTLPVRAATAPPEQKPA